MNNRLLGDRFKNSEYATFFDLDENGEVDILYGIKRNGHYEIQGIYNNQLSDAFFLKTFSKPVDYLSNPIEGEIRGCDLRGELPICEDRVIQH